MIVAYQVYLSANELLPMAGDYANGGKVDQVQLVQAEQWLVTSGTVHAECEIYSHEPIYQDSIYVSDSDVE